MSNLRIVDLRKQNKWTQEEVALKLGITKGHYCNIENGQRYPSYAIIIKLQNIFGDNIADLLSNKNIILHK